MTSLRIPLLLLLLLLGLTGCEKTPGIHKETLYVFGTLVEISLYDVAPEKAAAVVGELNQTFRKMHEDWHAWKPGALTELNSAIARGETVETLPSIIALIERSRELSQLSGGLFNPAIGHLVGLWGFHQDDLPKGSLPDFDRIKERVAANPTMDDLILDGTQVASRNPLVKLDFGAFAKGVALDEAVRILKSRGITNAIVNAGGDLNVIGRPGDRAWKVGIRHPVDWGVIASVDLADGEVLYTSGNYERFREHEGIRYAHIIDPRTGMPVTHIVSASVLHRDGGLADAAATALSVAGPPGWEKVAEAMGLDHVLLVDDNGTVYATPAMIKRVTFEPGEAKRMVVSGQP
ncbi:FAD:protein FMN transferase [Magnetospira sp. QH-2]|uniref:FAD:protein FMN transferase n=1 Tax=Magnetospira sp. (strain QH-2) TaxID=1288970 RepID=UPI0003E81ADB|nr:FAD:protein FMN transferase [Magnetospira sp. QH-2]CCQ72919.1 putative thiamine biosynthesis lipoprotein ApbE [Magnetospira sp. QH-2]